MTSQKDQLQTLIADIDKVLQKASPRLPWVISGDVAQQRRVLERVRSYLVTLQQKQASDGTLGAPRIRSNLSAYDIQYQPSQAIAPTANQPPNSQPAAAQQILQAVMQEMEQIRASVTQPLQADLEALQQQRETLAQEIRKLEAQRNHYSLAQQQANQQQIISEFLKVLMGRLQENLTQQISQTLTTALSESLSDQERPAIASTTSGSFAGAPLLHPAQRLEELQMLQSRSDHLLMTLDSTLSVLFEALNRNVQSYEESLSRGLERMHDLGQQGEVMFTALVSHLAQQLGREASSYLQSSLQSSLEPINTSNASQLASPTSRQEEPAQSSNASAAATPQNNNLAEFTLPYAGAELPQSTNDQTLTAPDVNSLNNLDLESLSLEDLDLNSVETLLSAETMGLDSSLVERDRPELLTSLSEFSEFSEADEQAADRQLGSATGETASANNTADEAAELDFLQQLNQALQEQHPEAPLTTLPSSSLTNLDMEGSRQSATPSAPADATNEPNALDEFYTLFGQEAIAPEGFERSATPNTEQPIVVDLENISAEVDDVPNIAAPESDELAGLTPLPTTTPLITDLAAVVEDSSPVPPTARSEQIAEQAEQAAAEVIEDLFDSFSDIETSSGAIAAPNSEPNPTETPASVLDLEDFSAGFADTPTAALDNPDPLAEIAELLGDTPEPELPGASSDLTTEDQFGNFLDDGLEDSLAENQLSIEPPPVSSETADWIEDAYALAAPDESLLESDDLGEANDVSLFLDDGLVQQLDQDLSTLESADGSLSLESFSLEINPPDLQANASDSTTLNDLFPSEADEQLPANPATNTSDTSDNDFTLEALDDFFGNLPTTDANSEGEVEPPSNPPSSSSASSLTEVDTQSITLDDVFGDFLTDEKKKIQ